MKAGEGPMGFWRAPGASMAQDPLRRPQDGTAAAKAAMGRHYLQCTFRDSVPSDASADATQPGSADAAPVVDFQTAALNTFHWCFLTGCGWRKLLPPRPDTRRATRPSPPGMTDINESQLLVEGAASRWGITLEPQITATLLRLVDELEAANAPIQFDGDSGSPPACCASMCSIV